MMPPRPTTAALRARRCPRAFTIVELLVTIGIIALLLTLIIVSLRGTILAGESTKSANAVRQLAAGYSSYQMDHNGRLLPGYLSPARIDELQIDPRLDSENRLIGSGSNEADASGWVWRLMPYISHDWKAATADYQSRKLDTAIAGEVASGVRGEGSLSGGESLGVGRLPSYGLNTMFLGGDDVHGGSFASLSPWDAGAQTMAAERMSEVRNPKQIIAFAPVASCNPDAYFSGTRPFDELTFGAPSIRPPYLEWNGSLWTERQWELTVNSSSELPVFQASAGATYAVPTSGWLIARHGPNVPLGHLDGSVTTPPAINVARDMRYWAPTEGAVQRATEDP